MLADTARMLLSLVATQVIHGITFFFFKLLQIAEVKGAALNVENPLYS